MGIGAILAPALHIVVAVACFGPIAVVALLGLLAVPLWFTMLGMAEAGAASITDLDHWSIVSSIALVFGALVGLLGLVWVLFLCITGWKPKGLRNVTRFLVGVGLLTLIAFNVWFPVALHPIEAFGGLLVYFALPVAGSGYFLYQQRDYIGFSRARAESPKRRLPIGRSG